MAKMHKQPSVNAFACVVLHVGCANSSEVPVLLPAPLEPLGSFGLAAISRAASQQFLSEFKPNMG